MLRICRVPLAQCKVQSEKHITYCADANCTVQGIEGRGGAHQGPLGTHFGEFVKTAKVMQQQLPWTGDDLNFYVPQKMMSIANRRSLQDRNVGKSELNTIDLF